MIACPFEIPTYEYDEPLTPRIMKCTFCHPRVTKGLLPGCVEACPTEALSFGKREDMLKLARERINKYPGRYIDHIYGEREMGGTNWLYLSGVPFREPGHEGGPGDHPGTRAYLRSPGDGAHGRQPCGRLLLTGIYAISKRKEKLSAGDSQAAVAKAVAEANAKARPPWPPPWTRPRRRKKTPCRRR